jgi:hypothetical protein
MFTAVFALARLMHAESLRPQPLPGDAAVPAIRIDSRPPDVFSGATVAIPLALEPLPAALGLHIEVLKPDRTVLRVVELTGPAWVGSGPHCQIRLDADGVEPLHARLTPLRGGKVKVDGYAESSGVYVGDQPVSMHPVAKPGEVIELASENLRVGPAPGENK